MINGNNEENFGKVEKYSGHVIVVPFFTPAGKSWAAGWLDNNR